MIRAARTKLSTEPTRTIVLGTALVTLAVGWLLVDHVLVAQMRSGIDPLVAAADLVPLAVMGIVGVVLGGRWALERQRTMIELGLRERELRAVFEGGGVGIVLVDPTGRSVKVNPALCAFLGYSEAEVLAIGFEAFTHPDDLPTEVALKARMRAGEIERFELDKRFIRRDGGVVWGRLTTSVVRRAEGKGMVYGVGVIRDITEAREAETELRDSEGRHRLLFEEAADAIFRAGPDGRFVDANPAACERFQYSRDELLGMTASDLMPSLKTDPIDWSQFAARQTVTEERQLRRKDGRELICEIRARILPDGGTIAIVRDLTERIAAEAERARLAGDLETIVAASPLPILMLNRSGIVLEWNPASERTFGWSAAEVVGKPCPLLGPESSRGPMADLQESFSGIALERRELRRWRKDRTPVDVRVWTAPLLAPSGDVDCIYVILDDVTEIKASEARHRRLAAAVEQTADTVVISDLDGRVVYVNPAFERALGYSREEVVGQPPEVTSQVFGADPVGPAIWTTLLAGRPWTATLVNHRKDGGTVEVDVLVTLVRDEHGVPIGSVGVGRDLTRERALESQLRQAQKMEAIGQLAGGVAHDFNNLLTIIRGFAELHLSAHPAGDPTRGDVLEIEQAANRASQLTRQLLAFGRRSLVRPEPLDLGAVVASAVPLMRRLVGEDVELVTRGDPNLARVLADRGQIEQVLLNLVSNARDAMPDGGRVVLETSEAKLDGDFRARHPEASPGPYVMLAVIDTGTGMDETTQVHLFEPFFTTKEQGKGTGLGLASAYGIVKQADGVIDVQSRLGHGTTIRIFLPALAADTPATSLAREERKQHGPGTETIILVEDEPEVRAFAQRSLERLGYVVLAFGEPAAALDYVCGAPTSFDALISDVVMPEMSGPALADRIGQIRPKLPVLFISGFDSGSLRGRPGAFLVKPFTGEELISALRYALDHGDDASSPGAALAS